MTERMERVWIRIPQALLATIEARAQSLNLRTQDVMRNALAYGLAVTDPAMVTDQTYIYPEDEPEKNGAKTPVHQS